MVFLNYFLILRADPWYLTYFSFAQGIYSWNIVELGWRCLYILDNTTHTKAYMTSMHPNPPTFTYSLAKCPLFLRGSFSWYHIYLCHFTNHPSHLSFILLAIFLISLLIWLFSHYMSPFIKHFTHSFRDIVGNCMGSTII